jgi:AraC family transcriptional regulator
MVQEGDLEAFAFDVPREHIVQTSVGRNWCGVNIADVVHPDDDFALPALAHHVLVINLGAPAEAAERLLGRQGHLGTGSLTILPAGAPSAWHLEAEGEVRHIHLYLPPLFIEQVASEAGIYPDTVKLHHAIGVYDPQIETLALSFLSELRSNGLGGRLYTESLANLLVISLLRNHSSARQPEVPKQGGLDGKTLRAVLAYIEDHLAEDLTLVGIAASVNLSPYHFARLFKESTGFSPHQYVIRRRVERAKVLLVTKNWTLTAIAHAVGFASESHLAQHFKRITGVSPRHFR